MTIRIEYSEMPPKELRGNSRAHWTARLKPKKELKENTKDGILLAMLRDQHFSPMKKVNVKYIAYWCGKPIDRDNLIIGMKHALDCFVIDGIIEDDNPNYVKSIEVEYHRVRHTKDVKLIMEVSEV